MINEDKTFSEFYYRSNDLSLQSAKKIWVNCDYCGQEKLMTKQYYTESTKLIPKYACIKCKPIKTKEVNLIKYGSTCNLHSKEGKEKTKETCLKKYGTETFFGSVEGKKQAIAGQERVGKDYIRQKWKESLIEKYGVDNVSKLQDVKDKIGLKNTKYIHKGKNMKTWAKELGLAYSSFQQRVQQIGFEEAVKKKKHISCLEILMKQWLESIGVAFEHQKRVGKYIADFFVPSHNLIIECDGLFWHSDFIIEDKRYHFKKKQAYKEAGYTSLFFRQDELKDRFEIVKSIILNKLGRSTKVGARKCEIKIVNKEDSKAFLNTNHLMGNGKGESFGLYLNNELIALLRIKNTKGGDYEVSRFCNKLGFNVVGGFSKLLKFAEKTLKMDRLTTFIDRRYGDGGYLSSLDFLPAKYYLSFKWVSFKKSFPRMRFPGDSGYNNQLFKLWDCGQMKFIKTYQNGV